MDVIAVFSGLFLFVYLIGVIIEEDNKKHHFKIIFLLLWLIVIIPTIYGLESPMRLDTTITQSYIDKIDSVDIPKSTKINISKQYHRYWSFLSMDDYSKSDEIVTNDTSIINKFKAGNTTVIYYKTSLSKYTKDKKLKVWFVLLLITPLIIIIFYFKNIYLYIVSKVRHNKYYNRDRSLYKDTKEIDFFEVKWEDIIKHTTYNFKLDTSINKTPEEYKLDKLGL